MRRKAGALLPLEANILAAGSVLLARGRQEFHGYELAKQLRDFEQARRLVAHGTLYKALERLQRAGLIESRWEEPEAAHVENRPRRRLYRLTQAGSSALTSYVHQESAGAGKIVARGSEA